MVKIAIIHYSMYGHVSKLAESVKKGILKGGATTCDIYQVAETLSDEILGKMHAPPKGDYPIITADKMAEYDGYVFGVSGRFGSVSAQLKAFLDSTGQLWFTKQLVGKPAAMFFSTGSLGGGQESIAMSTLPFFAAHGLLYVPLAYPESDMLTLDEVHGGSCWGAGTYTGLDGSRQPTGMELKLAETQGETFAPIVMKLASSTTTTTTKVLLTQTSTTPLKREREHCEEEEEKK